MSEKVTRSQIADEIEVLDSLLCDCKNNGMSPMSPYTGAVMDHYCDCSVVMASAMIRKGESTTKHTVQCGCGNSEEIVSSF